MSPKPHTYSTIILGILLASSLILSLAQTLLSTLASDLIFTALLLCAKHIMQLLSQLHLVGPIIYSLYIVKKAEVQRG